MYTSQHGTLDDSKEALYKVLKWVTVQVSLRYNTVIRWAAEYICRYFLEVHILQHPTAVLNTVQLYF